MKRAILAFAPVMAAALAAVSASGQEAQGSAGKALFEQRCALCHNDRGFGTRVLARRVPEGQAMLENRPNLAAPFITVVVRRGIGSMPPIREAELSEADLAAIAAYLEGSR